MTPAPVQLDIFSALARRERGQQRAMDHAHDGYREALFSAVERLAALGRPFTADDVRLEAGEAPQGQSPNLRGAVINACIKRGTVRVAGFTRSAVKQGHGNRLLLLVGASATAATAAHSL